MQDSSEVHEKTLQQRNKGHGKILLMDDEKFLRDAIGKVIKSLGYFVETARDGEEYSGLRI
jgi:PleD family two-component response regulator